MVVQMVKHRCWRTPTARMLQTRSLRRLGTWVFAATFAFPLAHAQPISNRNSSLRTLLTTVQVHSLVAEEARRGYPVHLRAVVTYYDPHIDSRHIALFVHDRTGSIFISLPVQNVLPLQPGDLVDVIGQSGLGDFAPIVDHASVRILGKSRLPEQAIKATIGQMLSSAMDGQWVQVEGIVHAVRSSTNNVNLEIATADGALTATTLTQSGFDYPGLVDSRIRLQGNVGPEFNRKRQLVGVHLFFPNMGQVKVIQSAPLDPFAVPAVSIDRLFRFNPAMDTTHRVHARGIVTLQWPRRSLCIQQGHEGLCMETAQSDRVNLGDLVDVVGFPVISDFKATLKNASYRVAPAVSAPLQPAFVTASDAYRAEGDGELVQLEGELVGQQSAAGDLTLMLRSGGRLFSAVLPGFSLQGNRLPLKDESIVRVIGVTRVQIDAAGTNQGEGAVRPGSVQLLLRSSGDIQVLKTPSWWTPQHTLIALAFAGLVLFAAIAWVVFLRRQVELQTKALRQSEDRLRYLSEHDALTNLPNRILLDDRLAMAMHRAERFRERMALLLLDLDCFKQVNDVHGHLAGDRLLCEVARRIRNSVRKTDTVARIGGDEFVILLTDLHETAQAESIAAKILNAISAPIDIGNHVASITASVGICAYPGDGADAGQLLQNVNDAMYSAKKRGRNTFELYRPAVLSTPDVI